MQNYAVSGHIKNRTNSPLEPALFFILHLFICKSNILRNQGLYALFQSLSSNLQFFSHSSPVLSTIFAFLRFTVIIAAETTTNTTASTCETGISVPGIQSWSVRSPSIQARPSPYPSRYRQNTSPSNFLRFV